MSRLLRFGFCLAVATLAPRASGAVGPMDSAFQKLRQITLENSPDLSVLREDTARTQAGKFTALSRWLPRVDLQLTNQRGVDYSLLTSGALSSLASQIQPAYGEAQKFALTLTLPLYRRSVHLGLLVAQDEAELSEIRESAAVSETRWKLRQLLGEYILGVYRSATLVSSIELGASNLKESKLRFELGQKTHVDVLKAEANQASLESQRAETEHAQTQALSQLLDYSGMDEKSFSSLGFSGLLKDEDSIAKAIEEFSSVEPIEPKVAPYLASKPGENDDVARRSWEITVRQSPVYAQLINDQERSNHQAQQAMAAEFPELLLRAGIDKTGTTWSEAFNSNYRSTSVAFVLNIPLIGSGSTISTFLEQKHGIAANLSRRERELAHLRHELENLRLELGALKRQITSQQLSLAKNREIVKLSFKSYQLGKATITEVLLNQTELLDSKIGLAKSMLNFSTLMWRYGWMLGIL